ncbi:hypothetical protein AWZ03_011641 [Drosophila navojoa]|uniref:Uncharacterized protein n=1 Tax=Drosophila navojoa TaxID=7232 RepID=A0A484B141_DRONA|nr:hypothetical protein AWZ03_011641 [Drosophila navojoa]
MSLLLKRRSRSETRAQPTAAAAPPKQETTKKQQQQQQQQKDNEHSIQHLGLGTGMGRRKTSAELISEAKLYLGDLSTTTATAAAAMTAAGGARLVSTRRPITPREPGRVLYGKVALAGRPPSAFS